MEETVQDTKCFSFGKYKGLPIADVARENPAYVRWCMKNVEWFELPEGVTVPPARRSYYIEDDDYWDDPYHDGWGVAGEWDW